MNLVHYYFRKQYIPILESFHKGTGKGNMSAFRSQLINKYGCQAVSYTLSSKPGAPSIWTLRVKGFTIIYKYNYEKGEITCAGVR